ncbi:hypothetical protein KCP69_02130 [Salmonella enterica subsp. enterica]|nr:hypothetical protein KCP69_02130 [Salmonella enterica subsp. enterica]
MANIRRTHHKTSIDSQVGEIRRRSSPSVKHCGDYARNASKTFSARRCCK